MYEYLVILLPVLLFSTVIVYSYIHESKHCEGPSTIRRDKYPAGNKIITIDGEKYLLMYGGNEAWLFDEDRLRKGGQKIVGDKLVKMTEEEKEAYKRGAGRQH